MMITIGSDHRGYELKSAIIKKFEDIEWIDVGTTSKDRVDYPIFAKKVCENILNTKIKLGILICGSGVGISMAANRFNKIYAALCWNKDVAKVARSDDKANVLVLPADFISIEEAFAIIKTWLYTEFQGGRYRKRLEQIDKF
ncbi:ribose 5-phosphate isomerase B [Candidatus Dependentiae bacterium]|nr:ribose 5-phosphate isomerase B [Candidatus Dependentiae bacterium]